MDIYRCKVFACRCGEEVTGLKKDINEWLESKYEKVVIECITQATSVNGTTVCVWYNVI